MKSLGKVLEYPFREPMPPCCTALVFLYQDIRLVVVAVIVDCRKRVCCRDLLALILSGKGS